ncbi:MAG: GyrI-like domain-containing protein [Planctomycetia bacterium]
MIDVPREPVEVELSRIDVAGWSIRTSNRREGDAAMAMIPNLWRRFQLGETADLVLRRRTPGDSPGVGEVVAVYSAYESDVNGDYTLTVGLPTPDDAETPAGLTRTNVAAGRYLRFLAKGPLPDAVIMAWREVWAYFAGATLYRRTYTTDLEVYGPGPVVEIYIAVGATTADPARA